MFEPAVVCDELAKRFVLECLEAVAEFAILLTKYTISLHEEFTEGGLLVRQLIVEIAVVKLILNLLLQFLPLGATHPNHLLGKTMVALA